MPKNKPNVFDGQAITANEFLKTHWQRSPYLFKNTTVDLSCLPDVSTLFEMAGIEGVQSRIIYTEDQHSYQAIYDDPEAWQEVSKMRPTLLVSDVEKWLPQAMDLMAWFPFIKSWRFDDLMMSYAPKGASVGAHTDHYDVFLVQVKGTRKWSYDQQPLTHTDWVDDSELCVIKNYQPQFTEELKPGDVLYLPPEIPHHGISTSDDCVTCSIGLRAPSDAELLNAVTELFTAELPEQARFKDAVESVDAQASITSHEINYLRQLLLQMAQSSDQRLAELFGEFITGYRLLDAYPEDEPIDSTNQKHNKKSPLLYQKNPFAVFAYHTTSTTTAQLFVNGEVFSTSLIFAQNICDQSSFHLQTLKQQAIDPIGELRILNHLLDTSAIEIRDE